MIKKTLFTIDYYLKENFINQSEIDKICDSIDKKSLIDYDYIKGNAKTSIGVSQNQFLDFHKDLEEKIVKEIPIKNQRMAESWCTIQKEDSTLKWHNHPNSVLSGILYLKVDWDVRHIRLLHTAVSYYVEKMYPKNIMDVRGEKERMVAMKEALYKIILEYNYQS